jgi:methylenetetrahydrofolate--tRNA-(uracil-5-)-methyltransferase
MNVNFGLFPPLIETTGKGRPLKGRARKQAMARRALGDLDAWLGANRAAAE